AEGYHREPFAADVSEGKNDPIYNAHSYHTKVPHKAIMRYILHYTQPGDIVFDGFCGTGMTGVAAQMCGDREVVMSLGYQVKPDGSILQEEMDEDGKKVWRPFSKLGVRRAVLNDLSPAATFISSSLNGSVSANDLDPDYEKLVAKVEAKYGWMYQTNHGDSRTTGEIAYTIWSDVLICPSCQSDIVFWDESVDKNELKVLSQFPCPKCNSTIKKANCPKKKQTFFDQILGETVSQIKQVPVVIEYYIGSRKYTKKPDTLDLERIKRIESEPIASWVPLLKMPMGERFLKDAFHLIGFSHVHHFFKRSSLITISSLRDAFVQKQCRSGVFTLNAITGRLVSNIVGYQLGKRGNVPMSGTLYVPSLIAEANPFRAIRSKTKSFKSVLNQKNPSICNTGSSSKLANIPSGSIDYIFTDPPFGNNLSYSELNILSEAWLNVITNDKSEAIVDRGRKKEAFDYLTLLSVCIEEFYRVIKPNGWITVEFHNSKNSIWNIIQQSLGEAGFVVADVRTLDKKGETYKQSQQGLVKADLIISAYKPSIELLNEFKLKGGTEAGAWSFIRNHLSQLPVFVRSNGKLESILERQFFMLFDRMVAFHVQHGTAVPLSANEFRLGLQQRFSERDGMYFLPHQVADYDKKRVLFSELKQATLFVTDEATAIEWLRDTINDKPQSISDLQPRFLKEIAGWSKNEASLELLTLLEQNFLCYDGKGPVPEQIHAYLSTNWKELRNLPKDDPTLVAKARDRWYVPDPNKAGDLEKLREKALLKEFEEYKEVKKKLKVFRLEAVRAGFKKAWQERDYAVIVAVADKIPNNVLEEDPKLLMWYDQAVTRMGGESCLLR
ncbi:MAG: DNA methylase, partial [Verrucomicrobiae bacterium]|nr:DNA methylase [Verrucomicrobiae bacterium]